MADEENQTPDDHPENVDKTPFEVDGEQPQPPSVLTEYGELPEVDPYG
jgi:hypothetical protein